MQGQYIFGKWHTKFELDLDLARRLMDEAMVRRQAAAEVPLEEIFAVLEHVRHKWRDPAFPPRVKMQNALPSYTGFSPKMIELALDEFFHLLDPKGLERKIETEFRGVPRESGVHFDKDEQRFLRWQPLGAVLHVLSGNVFLVGPGSLLEGLLTGNVTILKQSSQETVFMSTFVETVEQSEKELGYGPVITGNLAVVNYGSRAGEVLDELKQRADGIVIWGGESAVQAYRNNVPARTRIIVFGPKLSVSLVTAEGAKSRGLEECAEKIADELGIWDQNACTAPQICFVQGRANAEALLDQLPAKLNRKQEAIPAGPLDADQAADIRKLRTIFEVKEVRDSNCRLLRSDNALDWTVILDPNLELEPSPLHRTLKIIPIDSFDDLFGLVENLRAYIQTVGLWAGDDETIDLFGRLGQMGILRVFPLGEMSGGGIDDPHDGAYDLPQLMNLVVGYTPKSYGKQGAPRVFDGLSRDEQKRVQSRLFSKILQRAQGVPLYQKLYQGIGSGRSAVSIESIRDLPILSKSEYFDYVHQALSTDHSIFRGGYVTRSGGSTGEPSFSYFDGADWNAMGSNAAEVFGAAGFDASDRVGNFMNAGEMYGSFSSFSAAFEQLGAALFPFAGAMDTEFFVSAVRKMGVNAVIGMPPMLVPFLREVKEKHPDFALEKFMYAGMPMSPLDRTWLQEELGAKVVASIIGTTEVAQLGYQDLTCTGLEHCLIDDYTYVEIVGDQGNPVADGEVGDIVVTNLQKIALPVIRFRIGDRARIIPVGSDQAKRGPRRIEYLGRSDDILAAGMINLRYGDVARFLEENGALATQVVCSYLDSIDEVEIRVESTDTTEAFRLNLREKLLDAIPAYRELDGFRVTNLRLTVHKPGSLERNPRTGKLPMIIDTRIKS